MEEWKNKSKDYKAFVFLDEDKVEVLGIFGSLDFEHYEDAETFLEIHKYKRER